MLFAPLPQKQLLQFFRSAVFFPKQLEDASDEDDVDVYAWEDAPGLLTGTPKNSSTNSAPVDPNLQGPSTSDAADHEGEEDFMCMR